MTIQTRETLLLIKEKKFKYPFCIGILSKSIKEIITKNLNLNDYLIGCTKVFKSDNEIIDWLENNKEKHLILIPYKENLKKHINKQNKK